MRKIDFRGRSAAEILRETGQENSIPVNLSEILGKLEISAISMDFSEIEVVIQERCGNIAGAAITTKCGQTAIFYSSGQTSMQDYQYRFIVAHILGHCCNNAELDRMHIEFRHSCNSDDENEKRANIFGGELLIPLRQLEKVSRELYLPTTKNLAAVFEVPEMVMTVRLKYLKQEDLYI